jgi:endonuclease YncB( thermonuclease family)
MARVTLSFEAWKGGNVAPGQGQVPVVAAKVPAPSPKVEKSPGGGVQPPQPESKPKVLREQVQGQWRHQGDKLLRIHGHVKVLDAHTLVLEDGTRVNINGRMDAPDLEQRSLIGDALYPCGKEAAAFLEKLIRARPVTCYSDGAPPDARQIGLADAFVGETNLAVEMVRSGWAMAHHSGMAAYEVIARDNKRGLWRGTFVFPEKWRKGERLALEK